MDDSSPSYAANPPEPGASNALALPAAGQIVLPVVEEQVVVEREVVESGRLYISRKVHHAAEQVSVDLTHEEIQVERVPLHQQLPAGATAPATRQEGDTLIVPIVREVVVVETRLVLEEELRITKKRLTTHHTETVPVRREEIIVRREAADEALGQST